MVAAGSLARPTSDIPLPLPRGPERVGDGAAVGAPLCHGVLGTRSTHLHRTLDRCPLTRSEASMTQAWQCQWVYTCVNRARIWPYGCRSSLQSWPFSGLSHTPEISPDSDKRRTSRLTRRGDNVSAVQRFHADSLVMDFKSF